MTSGSSCPWLLLASQPKKAVAEIQTCDLPVIGLQTPRLLHHFEAPRGFFLLTLPEVLTPFQMLK